MLHNKNLINWEKDFKVLYPMLVQRAKRLTADDEKAHDIVMDCITKMLEKEPRPFNDFNQFKWYLFGCIKYACYSHYRRQRVTGKANKDLVNESDSTWNDYADAEIELAALLEEIRKEIDRQPKRRRQVLMLFYYENKKIEEISSLMGIKSRTVNNLLAKGRKVLIKKFGNMPIWDL